MRAISGQPATLTAGKLSAEDITGFGRAPIADS